MPGYDHLFFSTASIEEINIYMFRTHIGSKPDTKTTCRNDK